MLPNLSGLPLPTGAETLTQKAARKKREAQEAAAKKASEGKEAAARKASEAKEAAARKAREAKEAAEKLLDKAKMAAYNEFESHFKVPKNVPLRAALMQVAKALHEKLFALKFTKRTWEEAEAQLRKVKLVAPAKNVGASLGDTVLPTGDPCDDEKYADENPEQCESVAEAMIWHVIWCFFLYLIDTNPDMNTVGCAGIA